MRKFLPWSLPRAKWRGNIGVKALEDGVTIIGLTRGRETKFHHTEKLDRGEVMLAQFTRLTSAMKIRGRAIIYTKHGQITAGDVPPAQR
ncbi:MAG: trp RNA-binding attenuation protein MtrB [Bacillota bacterium]|nr:trp RNA-binding attenuation protein MtrB [Bacillota bacterium]